MGVLNFLEKSRQGRHVLERIDHMWKKMGAGRRKWGKQLYKKGGLHRGQQAIAGRWPA
jgi:hypothetical protein